MVRGTQGRSHSSSPCGAAPASLVLTPQLGGPPGSLPVSAKCYSPGKPQDIVLCSSAALTCGSLGQTRSHPCVQTCHTTIPTLPHQDDRRGAFISPQGLLPCPLQPQGGAQEGGTGISSLRTLQMKPGDQRWGTGSPTPTHNPGASLQTLSLS